VTGEQASSLRDVVVGSKPMFSLERSKNDTSVMLDFLRAAAAQMVCVGHALNFGAGRTLTFAPSVGVLIFFILSGFVIAHTLDVKSRDHEYDLTTFGIERFARIYTAFLPAILMIALTDYLMQALHMPLVSTDSTDLRTLVGNVTMRQGLPSSWGVSTFGSAGQLTSVAVEFHIYFFVGAIFFLLRVRSILPCAIVAVLFSTMPLGYFSNIPDSDRSLFVIWLAGFAVYYIAKSVRIEQRHASFAAVACVGMVWYWASHRTPNDYDLSNYPAISLAFLALVIFTQAFKAMPDAAVRAIRFAADYSFSLFLIHLTIIKVVLLTGSGSLQIAGSILIANLVSIVFALTLEQRYRRVADYLKISLLRPKASH
jgi:peptidoglycan/LPS O-acetylase OafA/YrhL